MMHYPPAPPSYTTSPDPRDSRSIGLGYFQPSYTETHLPTFRDDMNLRNLRQIGLSNSDSVAAKSQMLISSPQPSVDSGLKVDGSSVDEFGLRSNVESRESVAPNADSRPISRVALQNPGMDSKMTGQRTLKESRRDETSRVLAQSAQATIMPKDSKEYVNNQSHQQQYQNQQLRQQPQAKSQGETEITTSITKTTIPEETEPDGIGGLKVKRPAMSRLVLEQMLQSGDRSKGVSMGNHSGGDTGKGNQSNPPIGGDGCTISSSVTLESPYRYQNKMASMKDLTYSQRKANENEREGEREGEEESVKGGNVSRMKSATSMDSIPKKRSKSCHSYTFGGSTPGIGSNESNRAGGGGGEVVTTSKFERHKVHKMQTDQDRQVL
ncbi:uncharacterized protein LOC107370600 [Tetranychus urticae]|uniref:uncharacterized protein LOC107370600 n=1 Tax=Tetranychus urticae TaxID=32264 RepID=UPI00077B8590|nr:uncharacterized protein LOC107370600 [Tetranychus urticae]